MKTFINQGLRSLIRGLLTNLSTESVDSSKPCQQALTVTGLMPFYKLKNRQNVVKKTIFMSLLSCFFPLARFLRNRKMTHEISHLAFSSGFLHNVIHKISAELWYLSTMWTKSGGCMNGAGVSPVFDRRCLGWPVNFVGGGAKFTGIDLPTITQHATLQR